jgi:hypothetical protein
LPTFLCYNKDCIENYTSNISFIVACIHCHGNVLIELLPNNDRGMHIRTHGFMKYFIEMGLGAMMYIPSFIKMVQTF